MVQSILSREHEPKTTKSLMNGSAFSSLNEPRTTRMQRMAMEENRRRMSQPDTKVDQKTTDRLKHQEIAQEQANNGNKNLERLRTKDMVDMSRHISIMGNKDTKAGMDKVMNCSMGKKERKTKPVLLTITVVTNKATQAARTLLSQTLTQQRMDRDITSTRRQEMVLMVSTKEATERTICHSIPRESIQAKVSTTGTRTISNMQADTGTIPTLSTIHTQTPKREALLIQAAWEAKTSSKTKTTTVTRGIKTVQAASSTKKLKTK